MAKKGAGRAAKAQRQQARKVYVRTTEAPIASSVEPPVASVAPPPATPVARPATSSSYGPPRSAPFTRRQSAASPIVMDYTYVNHDLKRLGIILVIITVVMIALTFFLR